MERAYRVIYIDYFGIRQEEVFYAPDAVSAKHLCSRWAINRNAPVCTFESVELESRQDCR